MRKTGPGRATRHAVLASDGGFPPPGGRVGRVAGSVVCVSGGLSLGETYLYDFSFEVR